MISKEKLKSHIRTRNKLRARTYEQNVVFLIRNKYSLDDELSILRQRDSKQAEFEEYNAYCEECKTKVKNGEF